MSRPLIKRYIHHRPKYLVFSPVKDNQDKNKINTSSKKDTAEVSLDMLEALRLADLEGLSQDDAATSMGVSRQTFGRIIEDARRLVADALINNKNIKFVSSDCVDFHNRELKCINCAFEWEAKFKVNEIVFCPNCNSTEVIKRSRCGKYCNCSLKISY